MGDVALVHLAGGRCTCYTRWVYKCIVPQWGVKCLVPPFLDRSGRGGYIPAEPHMKKAILFALVLVLASAAAAQPAWFKGTLDQAVAKAKADHKLVLVDFYSYT